MPRSAILADQQCEPLFKPVMDNATRLVSHPQPFQHTLASSQVTSSTAPVFQTPQPPFPTVKSASSKYPTLVLSAGATSAPTAQSSGWDTAPPPVGDQAYVSSLINFYLDRDSYLEA